MALLGTAITVSLGTYCSLKYDEEASFESAVSWIADIGQERAERR